jgi:hypothetical protein
VDHRSDLVHHVRDGNTGRARPDQGFFGEAVAIEVGEQPVLGRPENGHRGVFMRAQDLFDEI